MINKGYIYKYTFPDGKVYIGQTIRPIEARHIEHITPSTGKANVGFMQAWTKYHKADREVLETVEAYSPEVLTSKLNYLETRYIERYQASDPRYGYNRVSAGNVVSNPQKTLMKAMRKTFNNEWSDRNVFYESLSEKVRQAFHESIQLDEEQANFLRDYAIPCVDPKYRDYIKLSDTGVLCFIIGKEDPKRFYGEESNSWLLFSIQELAEQEHDKIAHRVQSYVLSNSKSILSERIIQKLDKDGNLLKEYNSISEIMQELNLSRNVNIYNVLEGKQKTAYGYVWRWKSMEENNDHFA